MLVVPVYCARFLGDAEHPVGVLAAFGRGFDRVCDVYARWLARAMARRRLVLGAVAAVFVASLLLGRLIGTELFPEVDAGQFSIRLRDASGTRIERTEETVARVEQVIKEVVPADELAMVISNAGVLLDWPAAYTPNAGPQDAFVEVQLRESHSASSRDYARELRRVLRERLPGVEFSFHTGGMVTAALTGGLPSPIDVQVTGNRLEVAHGIAERVREAIATVPGAADVRVQQRLDYPALRVDVDRTRAAYLGLTPTEVVKNVVTSLNSSVNFDPAFWIDERNGNHYFLGAQYAEDDITSLETLENIPITGPGGTELDPVPARGMPNGARRDGPRRALLKNVARFTPTTAPTEVNHVNISRVIDVFANV
ncbi:MAG: efflux RND transporter permease subunit, partial [Chloroflexi bacterium]|nr:efflux RND transporter permease subunit [Chloroflexota bacterium]